MILTSPSVASDWESNEEQVAHSRLLIQMTFQVPVHNKSDGDQSELNLHLENETQYYAAKFWFKYYTCVQIEGVVLPILTHAFHK